MEGLAEIISALLPGKIKNSHSKLGDQTVVVERGSLLDLMRRLREDPGLSFDQVTDITAVDYIGKRAPRFEVVYHLYSYTLHHRIRVKVPLDESDPSIDSIASIWKGADWPEREVWDLYGIKFNGHPGLRRILMYPEFIGHPLRKDYPIDGRQPLVEESPIDDPGCDSVGAGKLDRSCMKRDVRRRT
jgi:NADH-quinone oxidoreductase subunit C